MKQKFQVMEDKVVDREEKWLEDEEVEKGKRRKVLRMRRRRRRMSG